MAPKAMAHEAFALSPISARATQPSEEDYEAISAAFMETARGRWFLSEFAKRNRNADTRLVLDAVARIEQTLVTQNEPDPDTGRAEALAAIKAALDEARAAASVSLDSLALDDNLAPVRKGTRIIKEISWRWREIGADGRICDLIDSQLSAIEASCDRISSVNPRSALTAAFDLVDERLAAFDGSAPEVAGDAVSSPSSNPWAPPPGFMPAAAASTTTQPSLAAAADTETEVTAQVAPVEPPVATVEAAAGTIVEAASSEQETAEAIGATAAAADTTANSEADITSGVAAMTAEAADAHDDAVLDLIAAEMAAPDPSDDADATLEADLVDAPAAAPEPIASLEAPAAPTLAPDIQPPLSPSPRPSPEPVPAMEHSSAPSPRNTPELSADVSKKTPNEVSSKVSLGSALVANGIVRKPPVSASDALAAIRRLSQAEKIALFS